jgi:ATP-dependent protease ClpP protease subunit
MRRRRRQYPKLSPTQPPTMAYLKFASRVDGIALHELVSSISKPTVFQALGNCDSISITVMLGFAQRFASRNTRYFFHELGGGTIPLLTLRIGKQRMDALLNDQNRIKAIYAKRTKISSAELDQLFEGDYLNDNAWAQKNGFIAAERDFVIPPGARITNVS